MVRAIVQAALVLVISLVGTGGASAGVTIASPGIDWHGLHGAWFVPDQNNTVVLFGQTAKNPNTLRWAGVDSGSSWQGECRVHQGGLKCVGQGANRDADRRLFVLESEVTLGTDAAGDYLDEAWIGRLGEKKHVGNNRLRRWSHQGRNLLPGSTEIYGDYDASKARWMASLRSKEGQHYCGGVLVAPQWVLTTAVCADAKLSVDAPPSVVLGGGRLDDESQAKLDVIKVVLHPGWTGETNEGQDIALLQLAKPSDVAPIALGRQSRGLAEASPDGRTNLTVLGWADKLNGAHGKPGIKQTLQFAKLPLIDEAACKAAFGSDIRPGMFCVGLPEGGVDSCQGDSGGPVVSPGSPAGVVGLVS